MLRPLPNKIAGYGSTTSDASAPLTTQEEYALDQQDNNKRVAREYLMPMLSQLGCHVVADVGCGVGTTVMTLLSEGFDAYGLDLAPLTRYWTRLDMPRDRFFVVDPGKLDLPFDDGTLDAAVSLGVIEHVGTRDGHAGLLPNYRSIRAQWLREVLRAIRPGGHLLIGCPNRNFPVDYSHGLDKERSSRLARRLTKLAGVTVHKPWGEYFLPSHGDIRDYLAGLDCHIEPVSLRGLLKFGRVPGLLRPLARLYVDRLPRWLWASPFNPWVMLMVRKGG